MSTKYSFHDDYSEGAHPLVLQALTRTNLTQQPGYGGDDYCREARELIRALIHNTTTDTGPALDTSSIYFTAGGTGANLLSIASHLRPHEAVISAESAHIVGKEGGAIEATGHQIISVVAGVVEGKLTADAIQRAYDTATLFPYQPIPRMVSISNPTEIGTVYTKAELEDVARICKKLGMLLLLDGARLGAALVSSKGGDVTLADIYRLTDIFWIGGTKSGALLGEAVVIKDAVLGREFPWHMKQRGHLLAKGRILGIQFATLLKNDLFWRLARHASAVAADLSRGLVSLGFELWAPTDSNQVFVLLSPELVAELEKYFLFFVWETRQDGMLVVRLVTSWATDPFQAKQFCSVAEAWKSNTRKVDT